MIRALFFICLLFSASFIYAAPGDTSRLKLVFAGDLMGHDGQISSAFDADLNKYNYDTCFSEIRDFVSQADIAFVNFEVTLAGPPFKGYPQFSSPDELAEEAQEAGFDVFLMANNHCLDRGRKGLERTVSCLDSLGIIHTGTFTDSMKREAEYPLIIEKNNFRLAILNYTYGTNGLKVTGTNIVNFIDTSIIAADLAKAETAAPDFIIATMHWGSEYQTTENDEQKKMADFLFKHGADIIIGSHPHVIQPIRQYRCESDTSINKIVVYSLGNFISNQRERYRNGGLVFELNLEKTDTTRVSNFETYPVYVHKALSGKSALHFVLLPANDFESMVQKYSMSPEDKEKFKVFRDDTKMKLSE